jgi:dimethylhistidine N-methyltransferase
MSEIALPLDDIAFFDDVKAQADFRAALVDGLSRENKAIPCRFLYDTAGSLLFDRICETPEYYVTRVEMEILEARAREIALLAGPDCQLIELGSGSSRKVRILLDALYRPHAYVAIDVSRDHLRSSAAVIAKKYPGLKVAALCTDYTKEFVLPDFPDGKGKLAFFPGSTIGNLLPQEATALLSCWSVQLGPGASMLIGVDLKKDEDVLNAAYNDAAGVTAAFTKNILVRANRELGTNFVTSQFEHEARYVAGEGRMEIFLRSLNRQSVRLEEHVFGFAPGERVHVEYSYKYTLAEFAALAVEGGFKPRAAWTDAAGRFSLHYLETA